MDDHNDRVAARAVTHDHAARVERVEEREKFSIGATFLGWCVASFLSLLLIGLVAAALGAAAAAENNLAGNDLRNLGIMGAIGTLLAMFVAYFVGGYAAGRVGHWNGLKHGAIVPVWSIVLGILIAIAGGILGPRYAYLNPLPGLDFANLTGPGILGLILVLAAMFGGAILGGKMGEQGDEEYLGYVGERRVTRGRPF